MDVKGLDTSASTARHWVGVYTQLNRVAELGETTALDPESAIRMAATRSRLASRLRFWQLRLRRLDRADGSDEEIGG